MNAKGGHIGNQKFIIWLVVFALTFAAMPSIAIGGSFSYGSAGTLSALFMPSLSPASGQRLGTVAVRVPAGAVKAGDSTLITLSPGVVYSSTHPFLTGTPDDPEVVNGVYVPPNNGGNVNGLAASDITLSSTGRANEFKMTANKGQSFVNEFLFYVFLGDVDIETSVTEAVIVTFSGSSFSGFPKGAVTVATVLSEGSVQVTVGDIAPSNDTFRLNLRIKEEIAASLRPGEGALKIRLPKGYVWSSRMAEQNVVMAASEGYRASAYGSLLWGDNLLFDIAVNREELSLTVHGLPGSPGRPTRQPSAWDLSGLTYEVSDRSQAQSGDIVATLSGASKVEPDRIVVGQYRDFGASASSLRVPTIIAGRSNQSAGDIQLKETVAGSLVMGRSLTLTLPEGAHWEPVFQALCVNPPQSPLNGNFSLPDFTSDGGLRVRFVSFSGADNRTARFQVLQSSTRAATVRLSDLAVAIKPGFSGPLSVAVGGTADVTGSLVIADVVPQATLGADVPNVAVGKGGQKGGAITISEPVPGALQKGTLRFSLPAGVRFDSFPTVSVDRGDLQIGQVSLEPSDSALSVTVTGQSSAVSGRIRIDGYTLSVDRTVPDGDVTLTVDGGGLMDDPVSRLWPGQAPRLAIAKAALLQPAPSYEARFVIGSRTYQVNGTAKTMDVAPYIHSDRTFMPVRFAAEGVGVDGTDMTWDGYSRTATLFKGNRVIQFRVGSNQLLVNGVAVEMDTAPEIVSDRVMVPVGWLAKALAVEAVWVGETRTAILRSTT
ncbi:hypothetical protein GTO91_02280 [Heliobacterium undosum]|uniref:Copper amine oxidase-like N-terminal domain-containing protein n=1 Tax=Heliomicrobium undosum TaxID=121734 RepID=A0A845KXX6_9FIRM|nr:copper amine oxidase N-terminal domain-containing protein [Heliomicrobium undosum]MZP28552.1 hypothetical protein [Heliomicrobium undosum]